LIEPGATSAMIALPTSGTFLYHRSVHSSMTGSLTVQ
jgi:hypothetical protein